MLYLVQYSQSDFTIERPDGGRPKVKPKDSMYIYLWYTANNITFKQLANLFGVAKCTAWRVVKRVAAWIRTVGDEFVQLAEKQP